jgi:Zn-dependent membrane protease YugP
MYGYYDLNYFLIFIPFAALSWYVQYMLKSKFKKFSKQTLSANLSGKEIAEKMLIDHGIYDVKVISVKGQLSDHYNPEKKTVNLSQSVYNERNSAAAAVAAHECGHAVQHAKGYEWLKMRSILVPMVGVTTNLAGWMLLGGFFSNAICSSIGSTSNEFSNSRFCIWYII